MICGSDTTHVLYVLVLREEVAAADQGGYTAEEGKSFQVREGLVQNVGDVDHLVTGHGCAVTS